LVRGCACIVVVVRAGMCLGMRIGDEGFFIR
jgi:hypothetical protein